MKKIIFVYILNFSVSGLFSNINETFLLPSSVEENSLMSILDSVSEDINSVFCNPAGISMNNIKKLGLNYGILFDNMKSGSVIFVSPFKTTNYSFGIRYYDLGATEFFDEAGTKTENKNLSAYSIVFGLGSEIFFSGLYFGLTLGIQNVSLRKDYQSILSKLGLIYIIPINETELHFGINTGLEYGLTNNTTFLPSVGVKYFLPEYDTFFLVSYKSYGGIKLYGIGLEIGFIKNINITVGNEFAEQKDGFLSNFGIGVKFEFIKKQDFDLGFGFRDTGILGQIFSTSIGFKW